MATYIYPTYGAERVGERLISEVMRARETGYKARTYPTCGAEAHPCVYTDGRIQGVMWSDTLPIVV